MEKNASGTGIIVLCTLKIRYGRGHREGAVHNPAHHTQLTSPGRSGAATRTRLSIVIKSEPGKGHTED